MTRLSKFALFIALLFISPVLWAASVTGYVIVKGEEKYIQRIGDARIYLLRAATLETSRNLSRLNANDYLQGQGEFREGVFLIQSIDFVSLYYMLGPWQSQADKTLVTFETYNQFSIYNPGQKGLDVSLYGYSVAPDSGHDWKIFISDRRSVAIASLKMETDTLTLQFINLETGNFGPPFVLVRKAE